MALLPYIMPVKTAAVLSAISIFFISGTVCWKYRKSINYRVIIIPLFAALAFIHPGVYLLSIVNDQFFRKMLGLVIFLLTLLFLFIDKREIRIKPSLRNGFFAGATSGFLTGMFGVGGPPVVFYLLTAIEDNIAFKASLEFVFIIQGAAMLVSHGLSGNIEPNLTVYIVLSCLATVGGTLLGLKFFQNFDRNRLKQFVYCIMLILGILLIMK